MSAIQRGVSAHPTPQADCRGNRDADMRVGKTRREKENGVWNQHLQNVQARRDENRGGRR